MHRWIQLGDTEYNDMWDEVYETFNFKPSVHKKDWPSFKELSPFITYDISDISKYEHIIINEWCEIALEVMKKCTNEKEFIYALDWSHQFYFFYPHIQETLAGCYILPFPDGDYYLFLPKDFRWEILTHPWEQTICVYGEDLINSIKRYNLKC